MLPGTENSYSYLGEKARKPLQGSPDAILSNNESITTGGNT
jgi:hypothetical protein